MAGPDTVPPPMPVLDALDAASHLLARARGVGAARIRTAVENVANADSTARLPGGDPYGRKVALFRPVPPDEEGTDAGRIVRDRAEPLARYEPGGAAADARGYVRYPNVNAAREYADLQTLTRAYESNLDAHASIAAVGRATLDLLR